MFAVIFEVQPRPDAWYDYLGHATALRPELLGIEGFVSNERFASRRRSGLLVSLSIWRDEKSLIRWRTHSLHHLIQVKGRLSVFAGYRLRVGEIVADTEPEMPLRQQRFDTTEASPAKAITLIEYAPDSHGSGPSGSPIEFDMFDSITRPGHWLLLQSWPEISPAEAAAAGLSGRSRVVRVIRDYGMDERAEAPQYFPPVQR